VGVWKTNGHVPVCKKLLHLYIILGGGSGIMIFEGRFMHDLGTNASEHHHSLPINMKSIQ
jgi:hypothetical protein